MGVVDADKVADAIGANLQYKMMIADFQGKAQKKLDEKLPGRSLSCAGEARASGSTSSLRRSIIDAHGYARLATQPAPISNTCCLRRKCQ